MADKKISALTALTSTASGDYIPILDVSDATSGVDGTTKKISLTNFATNLPLLGVNATADATNKLAVSSSAILFNHAGAGIQTKLNKNAASDTASYLFQTAFSGRAEFGLIGNNDFTLKTSADGSTFYTALVADKDDGAIAIPVSLSVGGGAVIKKILSVTATLDFPSISAQSNQDLTITVTGALDGDSVILGLPSAPLVGVVFNAFVSAANTVTVRANNFTGSSKDPASATYRVTVVGY